MRYQVKPGLEMNDVSLSQGRFDYTSGRKTQGHIYLNSNKLDLYKWVDSGQFSSDLEMSSPIRFKVLHKGCNSIIYMRSNIDRPKIQFSCNKESYASGLGWKTTGCAKTWELYQLEALTPKGFSETFEYMITPEGDWPNRIVVSSNGVSKYTHCRQATRSEAAEYFAKEFEEFKNNGFRRKSQ